MSGEDRPTGSGRGWLLPVIVVAVGIGLWITASRSGALRPVALKPVNWAGLAVMAAGLVAVVVASIKGSEAAGKALMAKLLGVLACGVGAILVICL